MEGTLLKDLLLTHIIQAEELWSYQYGKIDTYIHRSKRIFTS